MSSMKAALEKAGHSGPETRLNIALARAWNRHPNDEDAALRELIETVRNDAGVLWFLMPDDIRRALAFRLHAVKPSENGEARRSVSPGVSVPPVSPTPSAGARHYARDTQTSHARVQPTPSAGGGQIVLGTQASDAAAAPKPVDVVRAARAPLGAIVVLTALRREKITLADDRQKSLADASVAEVRAHAKRLGFRAEWLVRLVDNLPDEWVVGEHRTDDDLLRVQREAREAIQA